MSRTGQTAKSGQGFTLIEIVLVLAIAGLLLVIVFLAVSGAQAARRDYTRKNDASRVVGAINNYASHHNGLNPDTAAEWNAFYNGYIDVGTFNDPSSGTTYDMPYRPRTSANHADIPAVGQIFVQGGHWCNVGSATDGTTNPIAGNDVDRNRFAVWVGLEKGRFYCADGQ